MTDGPALVLNAFESVLCGKGVSVGFSDFGRSSTFTSCCDCILGDAWTCVHSSFVCVVCCLGSWNQCPMNFRKCVHEGISQ